MSWGVAPAITQLQTQLTEAFPDRAKPDGTIGDAAHSSRDSDHNPDGDDLVCALDAKRLSQAIDSDRLARALVASRDPRIKYVISRGCMWSSYPTRTHPAWAERPYNGSNAHAEHAHLSVTQAGKNSRARWAAVDALAQPKPHPHPGRFTIMDADTREYLERKFAALSGGPRVRDASGKVIDKDQTLSVADVYTLVEERVAAAEARIIAAVKAAQ